MTSSLGLNVTTLFQPATDTDDDQLPKDQWDSVTELGPNFRFHRSTHPIV